MILLYDDTLDGLLTAIFEVYRLKLDAFHITPTSLYQEKLFQPLLRVRTNKAKANRIKLGLKRKTGLNHLTFLTFLFNSNQQKEIVIYNFIKRTFAPKVVCAKTSETVAQASLTFRK